MSTKILRVVAQQAATYVPSQKAEGGRVAKCVIRLQELGGSYADEYVVTLFGNLAQCLFNQGDVVAAVLRFQVRDVNGNQYQDITASDVVKLNR